MIASAGGTRRRTARWLTIVGAIVVVVVALVLGRARPAHAHADLESTEPATGSVVATAPDRVVLRFTGAVDPVPGGIRVVTAAGDEVDIGAPGRMDGSDSTIAVDLPALTDGTYVVAWRAISADSHPIGGAFSFSIGTTSETAPGLVDDLLADDASLGGSGDVLAAGRWASYAGIGVGVGVLICSALLGHPIDRRRQRRIIGASVVVTSVGTVVMLAAQAAVAVNRWGGAFEVDAWQAVLDTSAGRWWGVRLIAAAVVTIAGAVVARRFTPTNLAFGVFLVAGAALFAVVAAGGHAISGRAVALALIATVVHLAAMSVWIGGLVTIVASGGGRRVAVARQVSPVALAAVATLAVTGLINVWRQVGALSGLTDTSYGRWLLVKTALVVGVVTIAWTTRWSVTRATDPDAGGAGTAPAAQRLVIVELVGIAAVLVATSFLVNSPPANAQRAAPASFSVVNGDRIAQVVVDPARTGGTVMHVYITGDRIGAAPDEIVVQVGLPERGIGPLTIETTDAGPGHVTTANALFPIGGSWTVEVRARYGEFDLVTFTGQLAIR